METNNIEKIAQLASDWWTNVVTQPKFDNGDKSAEGMFTSAIASLSVRNIAGSDVANFNKELYNHILNRLKDVTDVSSIIYSCDYGPDRYLRDIAEKNNIPINNFPWKTTMWIYNDACLVKYGYDAEINYIYESESYWRKKQQENSRTIDYWLNEGKDFEDVLMQDLYQEREDIKLKLNKYN